MPNTVLGDASRLIPDLTARNLGENARVGSGISISAGVWFVH